MKHITNWWRNATRNQKGGVVGAVIGLAIVGAVTTPQDTASAPQTPRAQVTTPAHEVEPIRGLNAEQTDIAEAGRFAAQSLADLILQMSKMQDSDMLAALMLWNNKAANDFLPVVTQAAQFTDAKFLRATAKWQQVERLMDDSITYGVRCVDKFVEQDCHEAGFAIGSIHPILDDIVAEYNRLLGE